MISNIYTYALIGGILIGTSACLLLLFNGRIAGLSGIINGIITPVKGETLWRVIFIAGLLCGAFIYHTYINPSIYVGINKEFSPLLLISGGILVGIGTRLGGGCTSGHGVCGLGRLSLRSLIATITFMLVAIVTVFVTKQFT